MTPKVIIVTNVEMAVFAVLELVVERLPLPHPPSSNRTSRPPQPIQVPLYTL